MAMNAERVARAIAAEIGARPNQVNAAAELLDGRRHRVVRRALRRGRDQAEARAPLPAVQTEAPH